MKLPLIRPNPPRLSRLSAELERMEAAGIYSNNGPLLQQFEAEATVSMFGGRGACLAVANATLGLMIAIRAATQDRHPQGGLALMPSFTFAATAHAAIWAGLTPLLCDIDDAGWTADVRSEDRLLRLHGDRIAAIVPCATFGVGIDLERYSWLARRHHVAVVVDAAAALGSLNTEGLGFGTGSELPVVFSMHATKAFATAEGGLIYSADTGLIEALRSMANFGLEDGRGATRPGLNAKLSEVAALLALAELRGFEAVAAHRAALAAEYRSQLDGFQLQRSSDTRQTMPFMPVLLPPALAPGRAEIVTALGRAGIGAGTYFSPHLAEQPYFREQCELGPLVVTDDVGSRVLDLPLTDNMTAADVRYVCEQLRAGCDECLADRDAPIGGATA